MLSLFRSVGGLFLSCSLTLYVVSAFAVDKEIKQQSIQACSEKQPGQACTFSGKDQAIEGICRKGRDGGTALLCSPKPPQQAFDACKGKADGDGCTFTGRRNNIVNGSCRSRPLNPGELVCVRNPPQQALDACGGKAAGEACSFEGPRKNQINGLCQKRMKAGDKLICAPARPAGTATVPPSPASSNNKAN